MRCYGGVGQTRRRAERAPRGSSCNPKQLVLAIIGGIAVWHVATRRTCRCGICTGKYTVKTNMGSGGFGSVFTCTSLEHDDNKDDCFVLKMIKIDHISEANEAQAEAKELRSLRHPLIVRYQDDFIHTAWGKVGEMIHVCIVMERCSFDLRELIEDRQEREDQIADYLEEGDVLRYFAQICSALSYCHHKSIMHRDIKVSARLEQSAAQHIVTIISTTPFD